MSWGKSLVLAHVRRHVIGKLSEYILKTAAAIQWGEKGGKA